ncbi:RTA1-domain-containing protein [Violaceomyces palustris]|uniref:RTA1-domain-containing protein n=1 Tax=Violaceomyces palustris TaxID=1673888 RepID=A0ACD0NPE3_9BASI|nr:RTA1-domain-containing protein [Violaceomyces palustris]
MSNTASSSLTSGFVSLLSRRKWTKEELDYSPYGYQPVLSAPLIFTILFGISALWHLAQNLKYRQWWLLTMTFGCLFEMVGNACRVYGHFKPFNSDVYTAMQTILVITPALFAAVDFTILGRLATLFPSKYSLVNPKWIVPFFVVLDVSSIAVQGGGSGVAASAQSERKDTTFGGNIVVAGLAIQLVGYLLFDLLLFVFVRRCMLQPPSPKYWNSEIKTFIAATAVSSMLIFIRSLFRLIEMIVGWEGIIARSEWSFYTFDAAMVTLAVFVLNVWNPAKYLPADFSWKKSNNGEEQDDRASSPLDFEKPARDSASQSVETA